MTGGYILVTGDGTYIGTYEESDGSDGTIGRYTLANGDVQPVYPRRVCMNTLAGAIARPPFTIRRTVGPHVVRVGATGVNIRG